MKELRQTVKNEIKLRNNILKLHELGVIPKEKVELYLEKIQEPKYHEQVLEEIDLAIRLASCVFNPLESNDSLHDILMKNKPKTLNE